jgi:hypothetical protein
VLNFIYIFLGIVDLSANDHLERSRGCRWTFGRASRVQVLVLS